MQKKWGLKSRIIVINLCMVLPVLILFFVTTITTVYTQTKNASIELLTNESYASQIYLMEQLDGLGSLRDQRRELLAAAPAFSKTLSDTLGMRVQIFDMEGELIGDSSITAGTDLTGDVLSAVAGTKAYTLIDWNGSPGISFSSPVYCGEDTIGAIRYLSQMDSANLLKNLISALAALVLFAVVLCWIGSYFLAQQAISPAVRLTDAIRKMRKDSALKLKKEEYEPEYQTLVGAFSRLKENSDRSLEQLRLEKEKQNLFFNSATHQLKTPLTSIIGYSDIIRRISQDEDVQLSAGYIEKAGKDLLDVVEKIIRISCFQKAEYTFDPTWFFLADLCEECARMLKPRLEHNGILLAVNCSDIQVCFDYQLVRETLLNLLDNCILYSGCTRISISADIRPVRLMVEDNGAGIRPEQLERIFEPFYRPAKSNSKGSGLGLSICKNCMTAQGGDLEIESMQGQGTKVILYFGEKSKVGSGFRNMWRRI